MILIVSDNEEPTTDLVIDWLLYYQQPCGMLYSCKGIVRGLSGYSLFIQNKTTKSCQRLIYFPFFTNRLLCF